MGSMNNWLGFSLYPHDLPPSQTRQANPSPAAVSRLISGDDVSADCFGLSGESASAPPLGIPSLRQDGSFGILEAFNRTHQQTQDWDMKSLDFKGSSSELSMVVDSSSNQNNMHDDEPKLEDFLGGHSFSDHDHKLPPGYNSAADYVFNNNCSLQFSSVGSDAASGALVNTHSGTNHSSIGLSMIKTWLRNQPGPQQHLGATSSDVAAANGAMVAASQSLSLSMSTGSQSSSPLPLVAAGGGGGECSSSSENKHKANGGGLHAQNGAIEAVPRKSIDTFGQRTSIYRGVTRHRWTGRYEAHLWDNSCRREGQTRKGRQVYLGGYDKEEKAARAYDLAALKYWGTTTTTNFPISNYEKELEEMKHMTRQEYVASLRRKSSGFSRGASIYRGVTRHHQHGRWQARIGRVAGNKDLYLGTFSTQEEAAEAYDIAAIKFRGLNAVTNFDMSRYDVKSIMESSTLPIGGAAKRLKEVSEHGETSIDGRRTDDITSKLTDGISSSRYGSHYHHHGWPTIAFPTPQPLGIYNPYGQSRGWCKPEQNTFAAAAANVHGLHDLNQLHLGGGGGGGTHNFLQAGPVLHGLMNVDSSSMEHSTGSNSVMYGFGGGSSGSCQGGFMMPVSTVVVDQNQANQASSGFVEEEVMLAASGAGGYGGWMAAAAASGQVPRSSNNVGVCHGGPLFTVWNDA